MALADLDQAGAEAAAREIGGGAIGLAIDVAMLGSARAAVAEAERRLGPLDILVNKAGWDKVEPFLTNSEETWDKVLAIDLRGPHLGPPLAAAHAAIRAVVARLDDDRVLGPEIERLAAASAAVLAAARNAV